MMGSWGRVCCGREGKRVMADWLMGLRLDLIK